MNDSTNEHSCCQYSAPTEEQVFHNIKTQHIKSTAITMMTQEGISTVQGPQETYSSAAYATHLVFEDMWILVYKISVAFCSYFVLGCRKESTVFTGQSEKIKCFHKDIYTHC